MECHLQEGEVGHINDDQGMAFFLQIIHYSAGLGVIYKTDK